MAWWISDRLRNKSVWKAESEQLTYPRFPGEDSHQELTGSLSELMSEGLEKFSQVAPFGLFRGDVKALFSLVAIDRTGPEYGYSNEHRSNEVTGSPTHLVIGWQ
jgi:hypothetical protein